MGTQMLKKIRDNYCDELEKFADKGRVSMGDIEAVNKLVETIHYIDEIMQMDVGYSQDGGWRAEGMYSRNSYADGNSYRGNSYGPESYADGYSARGYSRSRYSMDDGQTELMGAIDSMINNPGLSHEKREALRRAKEELRR